MNTSLSVCVYCGSSPGRDPIFLESAQQLGRSLAQSGLRLVYGGGSKGIMGAVAQGTLKAGGKVMGIIPRFLLNKEATVPGLEQLDELVVTDNMHQRKQRMFEESDAFVALPGGIGTVEEIIEIMTWAQLGRHRKPMAFVNVRGFWDPMLALLDHMAAEGFIHTAHNVRPLVVDDAEAVVAAILGAISANRAPAEGESAVIEKL